MHRLRLSLVCAALLTVLSLSVAAQAEPPHLVLARPAAVPWQAPHSRPIAVQPVPYPYGYFGARGGVHWQRQFGINRTYTQWSTK